MVFVRLKKCCTAFVFVAPAALADTDFLSGGFSAKHLWDDNFLRSPDKVAEEVTTTSADINLDKKIQNQHFHAYWEVEDYQYDTRDDLDAVLHQGEFIWLGQWGGLIKTDIEWTQGAHVVDRLEFKDKDIVIRDDAQAKIGFGSGDRLAFYAGGRRTDQTHWNKLRDQLDYEEEEVFVEADYQTALQSTFAVRLKKGTRYYPNPYPDDPGRNLDFDYEQVELDTNFVFSPKTIFSVFVAAFTRDGAINDASGALADISVKWKPTEKIGIDTGVEYKQPAVGEISESPTNVEGAYVSAHWEATSKISVSTNFHYAHEKFENTGSGIDRTEKVYSYSPVTVVYEPANNLKLSLATEWYENQSPLRYRDYSSRQITLGLSWRY